MNNFKLIQNKLEEFIRRYYTNELLKGAILFFAIGLLYFLFTLGIEYFLWLNPTARTILFWTFVVVEFMLFAKFIVLPLAKLFKLQKGINYDDASRIIGTHFPEVNDKLLNVLQLKQHSAHSELLLASIDQKSAELTPVPFKLAIDFKKNARYLKYAAIPVIIILLFVAFGKLNLFSESYERVVNYHKAYEPPAPFQFFVLNEDLQAIENRDYVLSVSTAGDLIPENVQIEYNGQTYFLQQNSPGQFSYTFSQPKENVDFRLTANGVNSRFYELEVLKVPTLVNFQMSLDYPSYTRKKDEVLKSTGNATIPEGTKVRWTVNTRSTDEVALYARDTMNFQKESDTDFVADKQLFDDLIYSINTSNSNLRDFESLGFRIDVVKDNYPEISVKSEKDSINNQTLYFFGQVSDDYGLRNLQLVYYPVDKEEEKKSTPITLSGGNFDEFISAFPTNEELEDGVAYQLFFQVRDNDVLHSYKSARSSVFTYRKLTAEEEEQKQLEQQNETIENMNATFEKLKDQDRKLEDFSKTQKEKEQLNFNDKKKFEDFMKRQKEQEQLMQNFNKQLKDNLEEFQNEQDDPYKEELKQRLDENEEQLKEDEKLLEELEQLQEKIAKEEFTQKLEELAKQNKNKQRSLEQILELTKKYFVAKKAEKIQQQLEDLGEKQEQQAKKPTEENTKEQQDQLNEEFKDLMQDLQELEKENEKLMQPMDLPKEEKTAEEIKQEQQEASDELQKKEQGENGDQQSQQQSQQSGEKAKEKQKNAGRKMKSMSAQMQQQMSQSSQEQLSEDAAMLRQILDNLVLYSFDQEKLMNQFRSIDINHNSYGKFLRNQSDLREHFEHIDDSLFALSLRQPVISELVNKQITDVFYNIDKSMELLSENQLYQGVSAQQYTVTATNNLASYLSDVLDNMEQQMNPSSGSGSGQGQGQPSQGGEGDMQLPDIIMSQEELNKQMEEGMQKGKGKSEGDSPDGENGEGDEDGKQSSKEGKNGKDGEGDNNQNGEGNSEELNGELYEIYQRQQQLRQALENKIGLQRSKDAQKLLKDMEEVEMDLINKGFTNQTLQKMMDLQHQLLKMDKATFMQGQDNKRESRTNTKAFQNQSTDKIPTAREYFNTTEILNRQALPLQQLYKRKVQEYFKKTDDQL